MTRSIGGLVDRAAGTFGDRLAVADGRTALTFDELRDAARVVAASLAESGVVAGARVGVSMRPSVGQVVHMLGTSLAGAVLVPILPNLKPEGIAHVVEDAELSLLIVDPSRTGKLRETFPELKIVSGGLGTRGEPEQGHGVRLGEGSDIAALLYSSGSTGPPKGVVVTHENIVRGAEIVSGYLGTSADDRIASLVSLNFDYGLNQLWQALLTGASLHLHDLAFPRSAFQLLASQRITALPLMPALVHRLFGTRLGGRIGEYDLSAVRYVTSTGGPISAWALSCLQQALPRARIYLMYGLTEAFRSSFLDPACVGERPTSIGKAIPGVDLHVVDDEGRECAPGEIGTLVHRGACVTRGYWNDPAATARTFRRLDRFPGETVVWSHDLARKDEDGYLYILGRSDFLIKRDGFRIGPGEIESVANAYPGVAESVAVGLPDGDRGQRIVLVWTRTNNARVDAATLRTWLDDRLPQHAVPDELVQVARLPVTASEGKFDRAALAALVAGRAESDHALTADP